MSVHGFMDIPFDDYRVPYHVWKRLTVCVSQGCWEYAGPKDVQPQVIMVMRLLNVSRNDILAAVPTCGTSNCARPSHICVTLRKKEEA